VVSRISFMRCSDPVEPSPFGSSLFRFPPVSCFHSRYTQPSPARSYAATFGSLFHPRFPLLFWCRNGVSGPRLVQSFLCCANPAFGRVYLPIVGGRGAYAPVQGVCMELFFYSPTNFSPVVRNARKSPFSRVPGRVIVRCRNRLPVP